jgi:hypothetical protein
MLNCELLQQLLPVLYIAGLALLPKQFRQEQASKVPRHSDMVEHTSD